MVRINSLIVVLLLALGGCRSEPPAAESNSPADPAEAPTSEPSPPSDEGQPPTAPPTSTSSASEQQAKPTEPPPDDIRTLAVRLIEPDPAGGWRIGEQAALELEKRGGNAEDELWPLLDDKSPEVRRGTAFFLLGEFNPNAPEQVDAFLRRLQDEEPLVRGIAVQAVQQMRQADVAASQALLTEVLSPEREPSADQRIAVIRVLQRLKSQAADSAGSLSKTAHSDPEAKVRAAALVALAQVAPAAEVVPAAQKSLSDDDASVRLVAAARLRQLGKEAAPAADSLSEALNDTDERVRTAAAEALVRLGPAAVPALVKQLEAPSAATRQLAVACLSRLGPAAKEALPALKKCLEDKDETVRKLAQIAIAKIDASQGQPPAQPESLDQS